MRKLACLALVLVASYLGGCATHKLDWGTRVGNYSFDQAVVDRGPTDKEAKLQDGTMVAEWMTRRGYNQTYVSGYFGYGYYPYCYYGPYLPAYYNSYSPDYWVRLTFDPAGQLAAWK